MPEMDYLDPSLDYADLELDDIREALMPLNVFLRLHRNDPYGEEAARIRRMHEIYVTGEPPIGTLLITDDASFDHPILWQREEDWGGSSRWWCGKKSANTRWNSLRCRPGLRILQLGTGEVV